MICALLILSVVRSSALAADMKISLRWPMNTYEWHYNPRNKPDWISDEAALALVKEAAAAWEACGVTLHYAGISDRLPGLVDGESVVGWRDDGKSYSAWTTWAAHADGRAIEADVSLYANVFDTYRRQGMDARLELHKSVVHEFGHVLGLSHSDRPEDAMSVRTRTRPEWKQPSDNDIARCRALVQHQAE